MCTCRDPLQWFSVEERVSAVHFREDVEEVPKSAEVMPLNSATMPMPFKSMPSKASLDSLGSDQGNSAAKKRLRSAVLKVKAMNRIAKTVRFSEETVVTFEVASTGSDDYHGLGLGDKVTWTDTDDDVPKGSVGEVISFSQGGIVQVRFPKGTWDFRACEMCHQETWSTGVARTALREAERLMREFDVLQAEEALAEALGKLSEAVSLERFEDLKDCDRAPDQPQRGSGSESTGPPDASDQPSNQGAAPRTRPALDRSGSGLSNGSRSPGSRRASVLSVAEAHEAKAAIARMLETPIYREVTQRAGQYQALSRVLVPAAGFNRVWKDKDCEFWVHFPVNSSCFEYRLVTHHSAGLAACAAACGGEPDLAPTSASKTPRREGFLGKVHPTVAVSWSVANALLWKVDAVLERFRWYDCEYGFFAESLRSNFPLDDYRLSERDRNKIKRLEFHAQNLWIPRGGGELGTVCIQLVRVDLGTRLARWCVGKLCPRAGPGLAQELQDLVAKSQDPASPHAARIAGDKSGMYSQLRQVEEAAARRSAISSAALPGEEIFRRAYQLQTHWP